MEMPETHSRDSLTPTERIESSGQLALALFDPQRAGEPSGAVHPNGDDARLAGAHKPARVPRSRPTLDEIRECPFLVFE